MMLIDFVIIISAQKILINAEISKSNFLMTAIENNFLSQFLSLPPEHNTPSFKEKFDKIFDASSFSSLLIMDNHTNLLYDFFDSHIIKEQKHIELKREVQKETRYAIRSGEKAITPFDITWGIFWRQTKYLIISSPLRQEENIIAGASIVLPLEKIYITLRRVQKMLFIYIIINTMLLALIGLYRISRITVKPVHQLLRKAEEYKDDKEIFFSGETEYGEFHQLSKALNQMLKQISSDKEKLRQNIASLEQANTELKRAQQDIIRAEKLASVGRLAAGIAHEIGNPIAIVIGYLELLKDEAIENEDKKEFIIRAEDEINRINMIIRQFLDFSRPSDEKAQSVSVHEIITDISDMLRCQPLISAIDLTLSLSASDDSVIANPNQLRQVFLNLIINAADAIAMSDNCSNGAITIISEIVSGTEADFTEDISVLKITCKDNGPGIPKENLGNIFDPFYTTKEPGKGTGLGLWVSFTIIEAMSGKIKAYSEPGNGTSMIIYLKLEI